MNLTTARIDSTPGFLSKDALSTDVKYDADDSIIILNQEKQIILYGNARVSYNNFSLTNADKITIFLETNEAYAEYIPEWHTDDAQQSDSIRTEDGDSVRVEKRNPLDKPGIPKFSDGTQEFEAKGMRYNFETEKALVFGSVTKQQNMYIHGGRTKMVHEITETDTISPIYAQNIMVTSCDAEHPHYGIRSHKAKFIPNEEVIVKWSYLEIMDVPIPIPIPFGYFPITSTGKTGLILPTGYEYSEQFGFGLSNIGFYTPISDYVDALITGEIYFRGRWGLSLRSNYKKRYKFNGNFSLNYSSQRYQENETLTPVENNAFQLIWSHSQDRSAHPYQTFSANVQFSTNQFERFNNNDANSITNNNSSSNISFRRSFPNSPFSLNAAANINQNRNTRSVSMTLPNLNVNMRVIYPFKRKKAAGAPKWYEGISLNYSSALRNTINTTDSSLFEAETWQNAEAGVQHRLTSSLAQKVWHFNLSPSISYTENWYNARISQRYQESSIFDPNQINDIDTNDLRFGQIVTDTLRQFGRTSQMSLGVSLNTKLFGTIKGGKGWFRGFRHVMTPNISFNFTPDNSNSDFFGHLTYTDEEGELVEETYNKYVIGPYRGPSLSTGNAVISYGINNLFEAKIKTAKDTADRKITLLNNLNLSGSVDLNRDSLKLSRLRYSASANLIKGVMNITMGGTYDYYNINSEGQRINEFYWKSDGLPLRFESFNTTLNTSFSFRQLTNFLTGEKVEKSGGSRNRNRQQEDDEGTIFDNFRIRHVLSYLISLDPEEEYRKAKGEIRSNNVSINGSMMLSDKWTLGIGNFGYDFQQRRISYPSFNLTRDLHCWELTFAWQPTRGTYNLNLYVKEGALNFIKLPYNRNRQDNF